MKILNGTEIKSIELEILKEFNAFCQKNNLRYNLAGGTLLGAIRHKGFIPWDDDIDVCMPRPDFCRLISEYKGEDSKLKLVYRGIDGYDAPFAKIIRTDTFVKNRFSSRETDKHLWIDIFPVDGLPENIEEVKKIYK